MHCHSDAVTVHHLKRGEEMKYEKIVDHIEETLRHVNVEDGGAFHGSPLKNPIAVVYVGEESAATHEMLYQNMIELWRPFKNAILFWKFFPYFTFFKKLGQFSY